MPQIVSGCTPEAERGAVAVFERITPEVVIVSPLEAEFAKLFSNAYRYIEFAATNEFYLVAKSAGVDYQRVMTAMKHNYPRLKSMPRPGFAAGPCLVKDTMQLSAFARNQFGLGHAALLINEGLVLHVVDDIKRRFDLAKTTVGLLGMAFKAESDDTRASLSYKFKNVLTGQARAVLTTDPFVTTDPELTPLDEVIAKSDVLILCAPHAAYKQADFKGKPVFDVWGETQRRQRHPMTTAAPPRLDIVIPVYNEGANIAPTLRALAHNVKTPLRVLICYDREDDDTLARDRRHSRYARRLAHRQRAQPRTRRARRGAFRLCGEHGALCRHAAGR